MSDVSCTPRSVRARSVPYTFFGEPTRLFLMDARMVGLPGRALPVYRDHQATFTVRIASTLSIVDLHGEQISAAETVTVLKDLWLMAPGACTRFRGAFRVKIEGSSAP